MRLVVKKKICSENVKVGVETHYLTGNTWQKDLSNTVGSLLLQATRNFKFCFWYELLYENPYIYVLKQLDTKDLSTWQYGCTVTPWSNVPKGYHVT